MKQLIFMIGLALFGILIYISNVSATKAENLEPVPYFNVYTVGENCSGIKASTEVEVWNSSSQLVFSGTTGSNGWVGFDLTGIGADTYTVKGWHLKRPLDDQNGVNTKYYDGSASCYDTLCLGPHY